MSKMKRVGVTAALLTVTLIAVIAVTGVVAQAATKFPSKTIKFIVPVRPGGGMDTYPVPLERG